LISNNVKMERTSWLFTICTLLFFLVTSCGSKISGDHEITSVLETENGLLQGIVNETGSVMSFKGIPYAKAPVGDLRWREPQLADSWEGVRDARTFGTSAMQNQIFTHLPRGPWTEEFMVQNAVGEDCLFLNVWTPTKKVDDKLPVLVFLHGGAFREGSGSIDTYQGEELARKGIIVVTINYRLGVFGFLAHPELTAESEHHSSGNYGFLDQLAALKWVQRNIEWFGGDAGKVTLAGQSAGAASVSVLTASPLAKGLFQRAITQSGSRLMGGFGGPVRLSDAEELGREFARLNGVETIAELRAMTAGQILKATMPTGRFGGNIDGYLQTEDVQKVFEKGRQNDTPFMTGLNADETRYRGDTAHEFRSLYHPESKEILDASIKQAGQEQSRLNAYLWLEHRSATSKTPGYVYYFDRAIPWPEHPQFGAFHTGEIPYVFNNLKMLDRPWTHVDTMVADYMSSYWANFVKNGDPNGPDLPVWAPYENGRYEVMEIGENTGMIPIAGNDEKLEFLKAQLIQ
jgi:para-nitrobenzyl esterase